MNAEIENIIANHDFADLSAEQLIAVREWAETEEEYTTMKQIIASAPLLNADVAPSPKLKASLMDTFAATYPAAGVSTAESGAPKTTKNKKTIILWFRAASAVAAVLLAVFLIYPLFNTNDKANLVAENKVENKVQASAENKQKSTHIEKEQINKETNLPEVQNTEVPQAVLPELSRVPPTTGPMDGKAHPSYYDGEDIMVMEEPTMDFAPPMNFSNTAVEPLIITSPTTSSYTFSGSANGSGAINSRADGSSVGHSDRLAVADLPEQSRQVIHDRPELLDLLHTSF